MSSASAYVIGVKNFLPIAEHRNGQIFTVRNSSQPSPKFGKFPQNGQFCAMLLYIVDSKFPLYLLYSLTPSTTVQLHCITDDGDYVDLRPYC
jgi:hypothetical protein